MDSGDTKIAVGCRNGYPAIENTGGLKDWSVSNCISWMPRMLRSIRVVEILGVAIAEGLLPWSCIRGVVVERRSGSKLFGGCFQLLMKGGEGGT